MNNMKQNAEKLFLISIVILFFTIPCNIIAEEMVIQRSGDLPPWARKAAWKDEYFINAVGIAESIGSLESARQQAFYNGRKEIGSFCKIIDPNKLRIESVDIWEVINKDGTYTVYRWLRALRKDIEKEKKKFEKVSKGKSYFWHYFGSSLLTAGSFTMIGYGSYLRFSKNKDLYSQYQASTDVNEINSLRDQISDNNFLINFSLITGSILAGGAIAWLTYVIIVDSRQKVSIAIDPINRGALISFNF